MVRLFLLIFCLILPTGYGATDSESIREYTIMCKAPDEGSTIHQEIGVAIVHGDLGSDGKVGLDFEIEDNSICDPNILVSGSYHGNTKEDLYYGGFRVTLENQESKESFYVSYDIFSNEIYFYTPYGESGLFYLEPILEK